MREELVLFPTARLAKEKGFDWETEFFYDRSGTLYKYGEVESIYLKDNERYPCPSQSILQRWLREVHKIYIVIEPYISDDGTGIIYDYQVRWMEIREIPGTEDLDFTTYEACLENALKVILELL